MHASLSMICLTSGVAGCKGITLGDCLGEPSMPCGGSGGVCGPPADAPEWGRRRRERVFRGPTHVGAQVRD